MMKLQAWAFTTERRLCPYSLDPLHAVEALIEAKNALDLVAFHDRDMYGIARREGLESEQERLRDLVDVPHPL